MSKWWGVGLEGDEEEPPFNGPPPYIPPKRYENKKSKIHLGRWQDTKKLPQQSESKVVRRIRIRFPISLNRLVRLMKDRPFA